MNNKWLTLMLLLWASEHLHAQSSLNAGSLPQVEFTEVLQGDAKDIGEWGDGNVYVIELWGTWCAPCIENIPRLSAMYSKYKSKGLRVIGYSWEKPEKVRKLLEKMGPKANYIFINDTHERFLKVVAEEREMVRSFPFSFVIDSEGKLIWSGRPSAELEELIDELHVSK